MPEERSVPVKSQSAVEQRQEKSAVQKSMKQDDMEEQKKVSDVLQSVHIALDTYDDIFSDFDPSPYETRLLSDDFLNELHKRYVETPKGNFSITLTLPRALRSEKKEILIKKRIKDYFKGRLKGLDKSYGNKLKMGAIRIIIGGFVSSIVFVVPVLEQALIAALISPLLWYLMWSGFEAISEASRKLKKRKNFIEKFHKADYVFKDQEGIIHEAIQSSSSSYR
jgi:hypothetical protein